MEKDVFKGNATAYHVWESKYRVGDETPTQSIQREVREFNRINEQLGTLPGFEDLSRFLENYYRISTGGSIKSGIGTDSPVSLSNCYVIASPHDSISGISLACEEASQICKRRGGVGLDISTIRPDGAPVNNAAKSSTGVVAVAEKLSNEMKFISQKGRRGAMMISLHYLHPDALEFVQAKMDTSKINGANISLRIDGKDFLSSVEKNEIITLRFPVDLDVWEYPYDPESHELNKLYQVGNNQFVKYINAKEYYDFLVHCAWKSAEPGALFWDNIISESIADTYKGLGFTTKSTNPCFHENTQVLMKDGTTKKISEIIIGDEVQTYNGMELSNSVVINAGVTRKQSEVIRTTYLDQELIHTEDHLFLDTDGEYRVINELKDNKLITTQQCFDGVYYVNHRGKLIKTDSIIGVLVILSSEVDITVSDNPDYDFKDSDNNYFKINKEYEVLYKVYEVNGELIKTRIEYKELFNKVNPGIRYSIKRLESSNNNFIDSTGFIASLVDFNYEKMDETYDVYDITVEGTHNLVANGVIAHNCGEIPLSPYDSCRLISINWFSFVKNPFTKDAYIDWDEVKESATAGMILMDNMVELELEKLHKIIKVSEDGVERNLWSKIYNSCKLGRRTGLGVLGLADMLAALGIKYDSNAAIDLCEQIQKTIAVQSYKTSHELAKIRGNLGFINVKSELEHSKFAKRLIEEGGLTGEELGFRRNIAMLTSAPTGSLAILSGVTGGIEPVFRIFYDRAIVWHENSGIDPKRIVILDGEKKYIDYIIHPAFIEWYSITRNIDLETSRKILTESTKDELMELIKESPYYNACAEEIDPNQKLILQGRIQKWIDHSISVTHNFKKDISEEVISEAYKRAYEEGCKGITVYRDGSRVGVLGVELPKKVDYKRPKKLICDILRFNNLGKKWIALISIRDGKPYELFTGESDKLNIPESVETGFIIKRKTEDSKVYEFIYNTLEGEVNVGDVSRVFDRELWNYGRLISGLLRSDMPLESVYSSIQYLRFDEDHINTWKFGVLRAIKKFLKNGSTKIKCSECGANMDRVEGCLTCPSCGNSKC